MSNFRENNRDNKVLDIARKKKAIDKRIKISIKVISHARNFST